MRNTVLLIIAAIVGLVATFFAVGAMWSQLGVHMTLHGWIAYALGALVSVGLAGGLFYLTFKSSREGYDEAASRENPDD
ncbi:MAG: hypothetical protein AAGF20_10165 [Pseudomonadota bacterium]